MKHLFKFLLFTFISFSAFAQADSLKNFNIIKENEKAAFHRENAERTFFDAKRICQNLGYDIDRQNAKVCFTQALVLKKKKDLMSHVIIKLIDNLKKYNIDDCQEWDQIYNKLSWCQYHYEQMEYYL
jgi:hypothetical protein